MCQWPLSEKHVLGRLVDVFVALALYIYNIHNIYIYIHLNILRLQQNPKKRADFVVPNRLIFLVF